MVEKRIKRVISKPAVSVKETEEVKQPSEELQKVGRPKRACFFCQSKTNPSYTDTNVLRRFVTDRAKIVPKLKSNLCSKHQRIVTKQIKYARHLALFAFTPKV
ncbi:MAG: 30S ribosomal protein S18 [Candidatus Daviesbacteria bacterium]|nr:30S ribosomal protein S18 [Candidatus Daviesbacteria bacterium]